MLDDKDDKEDDNVGPIQVSVGIITMEVEREPYVVSVKDFVNSTYFCIIIIDSSRMCNIMRAIFAKKIRNFFNSNERMFNISP